MYWRNKLALPHAIQQNLEGREEFSRGRLIELQRQLRSTNHLAAIPDLSIFASGSYGRLEAGQHSDIDLFFLCNRPRSSYRDFNVPKIQVMSDIIDVARTMGFPEFSNDGEFLSVLFVDDILDNLGGRSDDFENHFTARLLLLLEGRPLIGEAVYTASTERIVESYFRDYPHHPKDFKPTFLTNDILRFWKTLCLNYENRRNALGADRQLDPDRKRRQQIKNFKLKFSRLLTCFATIGLLSTYDESIEPEDVVALCSLAPVDRLSQIADRRPKAHAVVTDAIALYSGFLDLTSRSSDELGAFFDEDTNRTQAFDNAKLFGDRMFDVLANIHMDQSRIRYLVI
jgi:predicted nucleotidyltransferase